jgi:hypothetical protein
VITAAVIGVALQYPVNIGDLPQIPSRVILCS